MMDREEITFLYEWMTKNLALPNDPVLHRAPENKRAAEIVSRLLKSFIIVAEHVKRIEKLDSCL